MCIILMKDMYLRGAVTCPCSPYCISLVLMSLLFRKVVSNHDAYFAGEHVTGLLNSDTRDVLCINNYGSHNSHVYFKFFGS